MSIEEFLEALLSPLARATAAFMVGFFFTALAVLMVIEEERD